MDRILFHKLEARTDLPISRAFYINNTKKSIPTLYLFLLLELCGRQIVFFAENVYGKLFLEEVLNKFYRYPMSLPPQHVFSSSHY